VRDRRPSWGRPGADPATAALLNGTPLAAEQLQDGHRLGRGHPGAHVVPAVLAVAESCEASGSALLSALLVGYEQRLATDGVAPLTAALRAAALP
jgi:2-methylcitrate dehydratase PrpD